MSQGEASKGGIMEQCLPILLAANTSIPSATPTTTNIPPIINTEQSTTNSTNITHNNVTEKSNDKNNMKVTRTVAVLKSLSELFLDENYEEVKNRSVSETHVHTSACTHDHHSPQR